MALHPSMSCSAWATLYTAAYTLNAVLCKSVWSTSVMLSGEKYQHWGQGLLMVGVRELGSEDGCSCLSCWILEKRAWK